MTTYIIGREDTSAGRMTDTEGNWGCTDGIEEAVELVQEMNAALPTPDPRGDLGRFVIYRLVRVEGE